MREILFRAKTLSEDKYDCYVDCGEWIEGFYVCFNDKEHRIYTGYAETDCGDYYPDWFSVDPKTLRKYTGMIDKNGNMIFEGDIVDCWSEGVNAQGTVQQRRDGLWIIYPAWQKHIMWGLCPDEYSNTTVEIIGNIYDNPELLNNKK